MSTVPANFILEPDETVLLEVEPRDVGIEGCGCFIFGLVFLIIPGLFMLLVWWLKRRSYRDSKCVVTNKRILVQNWGEPGRFLDLGYDTLTGISPSSSSALGSTGSAIINLSNGTRLELEYVEGVAHFAAVAQRAMEAHKARTAI